MALLCSCQVYNCAFQNIVISEGANVTIGLGKIDAGIEVGYKIAKTLNLPLAYLVSKPVIPCSLIVRVVTGPPIPGTKLLSL